MIPSTSTTHTASEIPYSWEEISNIAKLISNNSNITSDTAEVTVTLDGTTKTLGIGDTATVDRKTVRILGFNHDPLTDASAYGNKTATGKAGISFEYVSILSSDANVYLATAQSGGWAVMPLRTTLNETVYDSLSIKSYIKAVNKQYLATCDTETVSTCSDKLWLLSCGEIWDNGYKGGSSRGYSKGTEGSQYKYYKAHLGSTAYTSVTDVTKKVNTTYSYSWWLRSPSYYYKPVYCFVDNYGSCRNDVNGEYYVMPGFSI